MTEDSIPDAPHLGSYRGTRRVWAFDDFDDAAACFHESRELIGTDFYGAELIVESDSGVGFVAIDAPLKGEVVAVELATKHGGEEVGGPSWPR